MRPFRTTLSDDVLDGWTIVKAEADVEAINPEQHARDESEPGLLTCGLTEEEGTTLQRELDALGGSSGPHNGLLLLGTVREMLSGTDRDQELREHFLEVLRWRGQHGADTILQANLSDKLLSLVIPTRCFGATRAGLPIFVEKASDWQRSLAAAAQRGIAPEVFGRSCLRRSERYLQFVGGSHRRGDGNGQYVMIMDCTGFSMGFYDARAAMGYAKAAVSVAMAYAGICRCVYVANGSRMVSMLWALLQPLLPDSTKRKFVVLPSGVPSASSFGAAGSLTEMSEANLPRYLGGIVDEPIEVLTP